MQFERFWRYLQFQITYFEEALLKNDAQNLLAERGPRRSPLQRRRDAISRVNADEVACGGAAWEGGEILKSRKGGHNKKDFERPQAQASFAHAGPQRVNGLLHSAVRHP